MRRGFARANNKQLGINWTVKGRKIGQQSIDKIIGIALIDRRRSKGNAHVGEYTLGLGFFWGLWARSL